MTKAIGWLARRQLGQAAALYLVFLVPTLFIPTGGALFGMLVTGLYSISGPAALAFSPHYWRSLILSIVCWTLLVFGAIGTTEALLGHGLQDDTMAFLLPFMVYPIALLAATVVWVAVHWKKAPAKAASVSSSADSRS